MHELTNLVDNIGRFKSSDSAVLQGTISVGLLHEGIAPD